MSVVRCYMDVSAHKNDTGNIWVLKNDRRQNLNYETQVMLSAKEEGPLF